MTTLTGRRTNRRSHLKLVHSRDDAGVMTTTSAHAIPSFEDPNPGPRDAAMLVRRFAEVLPSDDNFDGVFSYGES